MVASVAHTAPDQRGVAERTRNKINHKEASLFALVPGRVLVMFGEPVRLECGDNGRSGAPLAVMANVGTSTRSLRSLPPFLASTRNR